jgi:hypothetical protein
MKAVIVNPNVVTHRPPAIPDVPEIALVDWKYSQPEGGFDAIYDEPRGLSALHLDGSDFETDCGFPSNKPLDLSGIF